MRLCNALIQYFLLVILSLFIYYSHGHEHHNHVDPVTTKYSQTAATVDPLNKPIETANVQKNDFQQHNEDDHVHDTIEARLRTKHDLRKSIHQHSDDDGGGGKHESEEEYINRLNSALDNQYSNEIQFQYAIPPVVDTVNNTSSQNETVQVPIHVQNETRSSPPTSTQTPTEQHTNNVLSSTETPSLIDTLKHVQTSDEIINSKVISDTIKQVHTNEQKPIDTIPQNIIKEDILFIHKETITSTQPHQQEETRHVVKPLTDHIPPSSDQQQPISNKIINNTLQDKSSLDAKPTPSTPVQLDHPQQPISDSIKNVSLLEQQQQVRETIQSDPSLKRNSEQQQQTANTIQNPGSLDSNLSPPTPVRSDQEKQISNSDSSPPTPIKTTQDQQVYSSPPTPIKSDQEQQQVLDSTSTPIKSAQDQQVYNANASPATPTRSTQVQQQVLDSTPTPIKSDPDQQQVFNSPPTPIKFSQDQQIFNANASPATPIRSTQDQQQVSSSPPTPIKSGQDQQQVFNSPPTPIKSSQDPQIFNANASPATPTRSAQDHQQVLDSTSTPVKSAEDQQQEFNSPPTSIKASKAQQVFSANTSSETPTRSAQDQEQVLDSTATPIKSGEEKQVPDSIQNPSSLNSNTSSPTPITSDQEKQNPSVSASDPSTLTPIKSDQEQNISSSDQQQQIPEAIQTTTSIEPDQQLQGTNIIKPIDTKSDDIPGVKKVSPLLIQRTTPPPPRVLRSATSRLQQKAHAHHSHIHSDEQPVATQEASENISITETTTPKPLLPSAIMPTVEQSLEEHNDSIETSSLKPEEPHVETYQQPTPDLSTSNETDTQITDETTSPPDTVDLPRQVHVHDTNTIRNELKEELIKNENLPLDEELENNTTVDSFLVNDHSPHLPRILENEETISTIEPTLETNQNLTQTEPKIEETNTTLTSISHRQLCWRLPKPFEPSLELTENQLFRFINLLPEFIQTILFGRINDRETLMNTIWFGSLCTMCFLFSLIFLCLGTKRLKQNKHEREIRARCQQLQQYNNQIELERATFERQNQKLSDENDELRHLPVRDSDEELFELREKYERLHAEYKISRNEHDALQKDIDYKHSLLQKHEFEMQKQVETVAYLNDEILRQKQELEKERETIGRLQSNDLSLERFEKLQQIIQDLKSEITQLKQDKFAQTDQLQQVQERANQSDIDNNELTIKMKQLKDLLEQRDETITRIREKMLHNNDDDDDEDETTENNPDDDDQQQELLSTIDNDVEKANKHMRDLYSEIDEKTRRIKEFDSLLNQEKDRCRELETKLKVVLELRERDAHLHIRQLGQTDAELRKARTDTERVRILQQQLEFKQQQLNDVQKVLTSEQTKFSEECSKLQHETHEKWMEVKRLTRELETARKECEGLRKQITKYANNERSSQEKAMHKPLPHHLNHAGRASSDPETNGSSPPLLPYQQGDNFRPIDHERNDSGAASPSEMFRIRPPLFGLTRPPFFPPPFMPPHNPFMMMPRFPMPMGGPQGMISPISHLMTNGSGGGSDANSFEIVDSANITPNSTSYDTQFNGSAVSPTPDDEQHATAKVKKSKKTLKKKTKTSATTTIAPVTKEDV